MNSKNYRDIVLKYVEKLGEIDKVEDEFINSGGAENFKTQLIELRKEVSNLKQQIDNFKGKNK
jgi:hypothetical protein